MRVMGGGCVKVLPGLVFSGAAFKARKAFPQLPLKGVFAFDLDQVPNFARQIGSKLANVRHNENDLSSAFQRKLPPGGFCYAVTVRKSEHGTAVSCGAGCFKKLFPCLKRLKFIANALPFSWFIVGKLTFAKVLRGGSGIFLCWRGKGNPGETKCNQECFHLEHWSFLGSVIGIMRTRSVAVQRGQSYA